MNHNGDSESEKQFTEFITTGNANNKFLKLLDTDTYWQHRVEDAFNTQIKDIYEKAETLAHIFNNRSQATRATKSVKYKWARNFFFPLALGFCIGTLTMFVIMI